MRNRLPFRRARNPADGEGRRSDDASSRASRAHAIAVECLRRRIAGEVISDVALLSDHADLEPELSAALAHLQTVEQALFHAQPPASSVTGEHDHAPQPGASTTSSQDRRRNYLSVRCPHCHTPSGVPAAGAWNDLTCSACGSHFSLVDLDSSGSGQTVMTTVGHFELVEPLGVGGFGAVWKALDKELDRWVAIKIPRGDRLSPVQAEQFFREARAAAELRHPNIVSVHAVGRDEGKLYIVSDYVAGGSLAEWIADQRMTSREAATLCQKIALALAHAHAAGVVHRDLKPANILLSVDGEPYLTDFGLARRDLGETTVTLDGQLLGTPAYMSPEQARGDAHGADHRADIYSLGVILYELLTGELPFRGSTGMLLKQILEDEPPNPRSLNGGVPRDLATIGLKCLEKDPARRYATARELADDLGRFLHREPIIARPVSRAERTWRWCRRRPAVSGLTAAVAAALVIIAVLSTAYSMHSRAALREAHWQRYLSDMHVAMQAWDDADLAKAAEMLERHRQPAPSEDVRGFEWYYLWRHVQAALAVPGLKLDRLAWAVAVSHHGQLLATGSDDGELVLWRLSDLTRLRTLEGHRSRVTAIDFAADDKLMATGSTDSTARIWDVTTGRLLHTFRGHSSDIYAVAFSPDGRLLATAGPDRTTKLWDVASGAELRTLRGHTDKIGLVAWRDASTVITGSSDQTVREWSAADGSQVHVVANLPVRASTFVLSPNRSVLAIGAVDGAIRLLDARTGNPLQTFAGHRGRVRAVAFSADGQTVASAGDDRRVLAWNIDSGQLRHSITAHSSLLTSLAFTPDGARLVTASQDGSVKLSEIAARTSGEDLVCRGHEDFVLHVAFDPQGQRLASASADGTVRVWNAATGKLERVLTHPPAVVDAATSNPNVHWMQSVVWGSRDSTLIASGNDGCLYAWNAATGDLLWSVAAHPTGAGGIDCSPAGEVVVSCGFGDKVVRLWRATNGAALGSFSLEQAAANCVKFSPDGRHLACGDQDGRLIVMNVKSANKKLVLAGHRGRIDALAFSPDGRVVATGGGAPGALLWDVAAGSQLHALPHGEHVNGVAYSRDGRIVATASHDNRVRLWDVATGAERAVFEGHAAWVESVAFSPDGAVLASASDDRTVRLWRAPSAADFPVIDEK